ncbi:MAG: dTDP-4-dehydrorhamnose 3,5-epimerase [Brevefilum sp.]|nr:dTDP-4-dehydrorhamnose 3,5-epimerase [Brevefilum sp.]
MKFINTNIPEVIIIEPAVFEDSRGFFMEAYQKKAFYKAGIPYEFVQDNHSSSQAATLRGLHYQISHTQGKLVRVIIGEIFDVAVDLRKSSPHFCKWVGVYLSAENKRQLWIPPGFGHGFYALSERVDVIYKATDYYDKQGERCIYWNDPDLGIKWPILEGIQPLISTKDQNAPSLKEAEVFK